MKWSTPQQLPCARVLRDDYYWYSEWYVTGLEDLFSSPLC